jgi:hypothetical protein
MRGPLLALIACSGAVALPARGDPAPTQKVAVLVAGVSAADAELAENVSEVVIARVAQRGNFKIVGTREVRRRITDRPGAAGRSCAKETDCMIRVALALGATSALVGTVGMDTDHYRLGLVFEDLAKGSERARGKRTVAADVGPLVTAAQDLTDELLPSARLDAPSGRPLDLELADPQSNQGSARQTQSAPPLLGTLQARQARAKTWPRYLAYGSGIAALGALSVGLILGGIANQPLTADQRAQAQSEFSSRRDIGLAADVALTTAAALSVVSGSLFVYHRRNIFGSDRPAD